MLERDMDMHYRNLMPQDYREAIDILQNSYTDFEEHKSNEEYRKFVEDDLGLHFYIYSEKDIGGEHDGRIYPLARWIVINTEADGYRYCMAFVHEAIHLKEFIGQADYVCFETFKYLYESEELHNVGVWYGLSQIYGFYSDEYDISQHIVSYLTNN